ncbi:hypothetical protein [Pseudomonas aeruginosa]|uniref:hypothetical protein n=1 Tax=Pseudomonas aeruginosa TaxID=287 RepID=UPI0034E0BC2A
MEQQPLWTKAEIVEFDELVDGVSSLHQLERIDCRLRLSKFVKAHGQEKCDAMFAHLESGGAKEDGPLVDAPADSSKSEGVAP